FLLRVHLFTFALCLSRFLTQLIRSSPSRSSRFSMMVSSRSFFTLILLTFFSCLLASANAQDGTECSASLPCKVGCCSKFGFCGFGADYCSKSVCTNNCDRKAECDPGGFGKDYVNKTTCPLNVCCSKHGFCGTTEEFCGNKKVSRPSCTVDKSSKFKRVVGYYETWSASRSCNRFFPEQIPRGVYSHINIAFASINPTTFEIVPAKKEDLEMYKRVSALKAKDPNLKVLIAVGGWTFNDPGPTATTFSDIARSASAQKKFFDSTIKMLETYDLDGIDLDWEYPEANDRSGRPEDFANFPKFMKSLKAALKKYEVSITLPASYWYLQHFDLKALSPHVDFFNMMTYDFHGVWDKPNEFVGPYLNSHTNLTEIKGGLDLLWRNGVDKDKVTLGLAFYGRGFIASSSSCMSPGCTYESGTYAQACSAEVGVALNSEIDQLVSEQGAKATLNKDAAVKIVTWGGNNWLTFDDEETLRLKADYARSLCIGGVMVWAISHDTRAGKYSMALSRVAPRLFTSEMATEEDDGYVTDVEEHKQCRWTNCDENCPSDWTRMMRSGPGAGKNEYMVNGAGCGGRGEHKLCCPPGNKPTCGWYKHNNGDCDSGKSCPSGYKEIGSNNEYCHTQGGGFSPIRSYQAACCSMETDNMKLYSQCDWSAKIASSTWPSCEKATCGSDVIAFSGDGSGDAMCWGAWYKGGMEDSKKNKYCCDQPEEDKKWKDCEWQGMTDWTDEDTGLKFCDPSCSGGLTMVAMEHTGCSGGGARARCCKPGWTTSTTRYENSEDEYFESHIKLFMSNPVCSSNIFFGNPLKARDEQSVSYSNGTLASRQIWGIGDIQSFATEQYMEKMVSELFMGTPRESTKSIWNNTMLSYSEFNSLSYANLHDYQQAQGYDYYLQLGTQWPRYVVCNLGSINAAIKGGDGDGDGTCTITCACTRDDCCAEDDDTCINWSKDGETTALQKRGEKKPYPWIAVDPFTRAQASLPWNAPSYPSPGDLNVNTERTHFADAWTYDPNCANFDPIVIDLLPNGPTGPMIKGYENDHPFERKMTSIWGDDALFGRLAADVGESRYAVPFDFFTVSLQQTNAAGQTIQNMLMNTLGSKTNRGVMTLMIKDANLLKEKLWTLRDDLVSPTKMENLVYGNCPKDALDQIKKVLSVYRYHLRPGFHDKLKKVVNDFRDLLRIAEQHYASTHGGASPNAVNHFDEWFKTTLEKMKDVTQEVGNQWLPELARNPAVTGNAVDNSIRQNLVNAFNSLPDIDTTGFFP
ncbi:glycosyl hydrolase family 18, partial [Colletotrichum tamarilloi]